MSIYQHTNYKVFTSQKEHGNNPRKKYTEGKKRLFISKAKQ